VSEPTVVRVDLGQRSYDIVVGAGLLADAGARLAAIAGNGQLVVVTDTDLADTGHPGRLGAALDAAGLRHRQLVVPAGEASKSMARLGELLDDLLEGGIERGTTVVALGGGVIGDLAGFAAAILLRGVAYVQVPYLLLAALQLKILEIF